MPSKRSEKEEDSLTLDINKEEIEEGEMEENNVYFIFNNLQVNSNWHNDN